MTELKLRCSARARDCPGCMERTAAIASENVLTVRSGFCRSDCGLQGSSMEITRRPAAFFQSISRRRNFADHKTGSQVYFQHLVEHERAFPALVFGSMQGSPNSSPTVKARISTAMDLPAMQPPFSYIDCAQAWAQLCVPRPTSGWLVSFHEKKSGCF